MSDTRNDIGIADGETGTEVLSEAQVTEFHERGVLKVDFGFPEQLLDNIVSKLHEHYDEDFNRGRMSGTRIQDAWQMVDEARWLAVDSRVLQALEQLLGRRPRPFQTLNFPVGTTQLAHSDTIHFSTIPEGYMVGVWVALEDIDSDNGPLIYYPRSHKLPYYKMHDFALEPGYDNYASYEQRIQELIRKHDLQAEYGFARKGEAIIWHANLLHGGAPRKDSERSRHSQVTHYYFEACKYYTPMNSTARKMNFRDPVWIPLTDEEFLSRNYLEVPGLTTRMLRGLKRVARRVLPAKAVNKKAVNKKTVNKKAANKTSND